MSDFDHDAIQWLASSAGNEIISLAATEPDALKAQTLIRKRFPTIDSALISHAIGQAKLRELATKRWGVDCSAFLFTEDGLAQATRPVVSNYRAERMRQLGFTSGIDLTAGLGFDMLGFIQSGIAMSGVERDSAIAALAQTNLSHTEAQVEVGDATTYAISRNVDFVFIDPARRDTQGPSNSDGTTKRQFNPERWSPPWSFIEQLSSRQRVLVKAAPGMDVTGLQDWDVEWISVDGSLVEANLLSGGTGKRAATLLTQTSSERRTFSSGEQAPTQSVGSHLVLPDPSLIRAHALDDLCERVNGGLVNEHIAWITSNDVVAVMAEFEKSPRAIDVLQIVGESRIDERDLRAAIKEHGASSITVMTRGIETNVETLRKSLLKATSKGKGEIILALYRDEPSARALICRRLTMRG